MNAMLTLFFLALFANDVLGVKVSHPSLDWQMTFATLIAL
jgi:hypothetical protein